MNAYWHFARQHNLPHVRFLKSHDFQLNDATFTPPPGMVRLIQIRRPLHLLASWLELEQLAHNRQLLQEASLVLERIFLYHEPEVLEEAWRVIDRAGSVMSEEQVEHWLQDKTTYVAGFLNKWLPLATAFPFANEVSDGNLVLRYEDLGRWPDLPRSLQLAIATVGGSTNFMPREGDVMKRRSDLVSRLLQANEALLRSAEEDVLAMAPGIDELYGSELSTTVR